MPQKHSLVLIKLGGSVITDKSTPYTANIPAIRSITNVLKRVKSPLIISHGSGSFGHTSASLYGGKKGYTSPLGIATVARDAMAINSIIISECIRSDLPAISFRPMSFFTADKGELAKGFYDPIDQALSQSLIPVVYGDVIWDKEWKSTIFSGETTLGYLAIYFQKKYSIQIIELCDVSGVLDATGQVIPDITPDTWEKIKSESITPTIHDVTGGMMHKVEEALTLAKAGIPTRIIDGRDSTILEKVLAGAKAYGTSIHL